MLPRPISLLLQVSFDQSDKEGGRSDAKATFQPSLTISITNCSDHVRKSQVGGHHVQNISLSFTQCTYPMNSEIVDP